MSSSVPVLYDDEGVEFTTTERRPIAPKSSKAPKTPGLMTLAGESAGRVFRIAGARAVVGRARDCEVTVVDAGVSRRHCVLLANEDGSYRVEDLGSTNGTLLNGERVMRADIGAGDRLQLGPELVFQFSWFDQTEEELANRLVEAARFDALTGALNRRAFEERLAAELAYAMRHGERLSLVAFDIDHFKSVNDKFGHGGGDAVLKSVASLVKSTLRAEDIFARVGGEEFLVVARGLTREAARLLAERLRRVVESHTVSCPPDELRVTISLGVGELEEAGAIDPLLELVDDRLYKAKHAGRNRVVHE